jgi:oligoribonuclease
MILWTDIETSGLAERSDHLLEVAMVVTDDQLREIAHHSVVCFPVGITVDQLVEQMAPIVRDMHTKNGLLDELRWGRALRRHEAEISLTSFLETVFKDVPQVEDERNCQCGKWKSWHLGYGGSNSCGLAATVAGIVVDGDKVAGGFLPALVPALSKTPLAGSTVSFDRRWLVEHMPDLSKLWSYRNIDVSSIGELAARWTPVAHSLRPQSTDKHRALDDVRGSIELLKYWRSVVFTDSTSFDSNVMRMRDLGLKVSR